MSLARLSADAVEDRMLAPGTPSLELLFATVGDAGNRMSDIAGAEGAAGNISVYVEGLADVARAFPLTEEVSLSAAVPGLSRGSVLVTGSGCRLRELAIAPTAHLGLVQVHPDGARATVRFARERSFARLTSELDSHLAVHAERLRTSPARCHALVHAQPVHVTFLTHIARYQGGAELTRALFRWQAETVLNLPEGIGFVPFCVPGSPELVERTLEAMRRHQGVVWGQHGLLVRAEGSAQRAADLIEYIETAARYEYMNLACGGAASGIDPERLRDVCRAHAIDPYWL